jgi:hypothetical protein
MHTPPLILGRGRSDAPERKLLTDYFVENWLAFVFLEVLEMAENVETNEKKSKFWDRWMGQQGQEGRGDVM